MEDFQKKTRGQELSFHNGRVGTYDGLQLHLVHSLFLTSYLYIIYQSKLKFIVYLS